jgi:hypothetical protein
MRKSEGGNTVFTAGKRDTTNARTRPDCLGGLARESTCIRVVDTETQDLGGEVELIRGKTTEASSSMISRDRNVRTSSSLHGLSCLDLEKVRQLALLSAKSFR